MNDTPGRTPPGSSPSDDRRPPAQDTSAPEGPTPVDGTPGTGEDARSSQWSQEQPPGGQWSTTAPVPPQRRTTRERAYANSGRQHTGGPQQPQQSPQRQPGAPWGGWGAWTPPPQAPQPGVIPLRPLSVGEIVDGAVQVVRRQWRTALGVSLALAVGTQAVTTVLTSLWFHDAPDLQSISENADATPQELWEALRGTLAGTGVAWAVGLLGSIVATAMLTMVVSHSILGRTTTIGEAWRAARPQMPRMFGLLLLLPLLLCAVFAIGVSPGLVVTAAGAEGPGAGLIALGALAASVVGAWLWIRFSLAVPALMLEKQGVIASMRRSAKLVQGAWWRVFGVQLLGVLLTVMLTMVVQAPLSIVASFASGATMENPMSWPSLVVAGIGGAISATLAFPVTAGMAALLYTDQRIRRESLDLELARAAGVDVSA
ncbi:hypothetical protein [Streptomyces sp. UNOC14_S4]|uniref:DUF7544 domain-containing protein n=1 Tax=Streptomyces sp. UNOC14_S4 TaxID=2872340 RepID=UPI001E3D1E71|nr:hypothetical protein [Streptomyces sp. UNOC14_S4]MCC3771001.1 hypothetical protein [Streptomyces sp. UNOC14_S4]